MKKILTLCIIHQNDRILLGMKKRGFGMGNWNGFGGKINEGEGIEDAAKRELFEEAGISANDLEKMGELEFFWKGKEDSMHVTVFKTDVFEGQPIETEEMKPQWFLVNEIPYENMWDDDRHWLPLFLENKKFTGKFLFDENNIVLEHELKEQ